MSLDSTQLRLDNLIDDMENAIAMNCDGDKHPDKRDCQVLHDAWVPLRERLEATIQSFDSEDLKMLAQLCIEADGPDEDDDKGFSRALLRLVAATIPQTPKQADGQVIEIVVDASIGETPERHKHDWITYDLVNGAKFAACSFVGCPGSVQLV